MTFIFLVVRGRGLENRNKELTKMFTVTTTLLENQLSYLGMLLFLRYIKETNIKNDPIQLNNLIKKNCDVVTWTPRPGATLDLGRMLKDPTDRSGDKNTLYNVYNIMTKSS